MNEHKLEIELKKAFDYLSKKAGIAYMDIDMLSNETFSKNPFSSSFIRDFLEKNFVKNRLIVVLIVKNIFIYYIRNIAAILVYFLNYLIFKVAYYKACDFNGAKEITLIDTFFLVKKINMDGRFEDGYFGNLENILISNKQRYAYLPVMYGTKNPFLLYKTFRILKSQQVPFVSEFQLLFFVDFLMLFMFILRYPFKVFRFYFTLTDEKLDLLLKKSIIQGLPDVVIWSRSRYIQGLRLERLKAKKIKLISWFENQAIDKSLYKGIRNSREDVYIIGANLSIRPPIELNLCFGANEDAELNNLPHKILVNGSYYKTNIKNIAVCVGPSLRYRRVFETSLPSILERRSILVLLPYFIESGRFMLELLNKANLPYNIIIKAHPATDMSKFANLLKPEYSIVEQNIYDLAIDARFIVSCSTGAMLEMASIGVPLIAVRGKDVLDYNPMPNCGKGIIWHQVSSLETMLKAIASIDSYEKQEDTIIEIANEYKKIFFKFPNEETIKHTFEIEGVSP